jgi:hypothetical protein
MSDRGAAAPGATRDSLGALLDCLDELAAKQDEQAQLGCPQTLDAATLGAAQPGRFSLLEIGSTSGTIA